jgi:membrane protein DedA with SNARE-associated domain
MIGASIAYAIGYWGREELVERHGNKLHISKSRLDRAHRWFDRYGAPVIMVSRCIPFARAAFPYAAGVARMGYVRFLIFGTIGSIVWITALGVLGNAVGSSWQSWRHNLEYVDYVAAVLLLVAIGYLIVRLTRTRRDDPTAVA